MTFPRANSPDALYDAVADHDLVVVPDAPLASALTRRLDRPHLGAFATTPRRLAAGRREAAEDRLAFLDLVEETDLDWKRAAYAVGNILQCWEHQGSLDAILEYDAYADDATRTAVDRLADLETTSRRLTEYRIDPDTDVAVVGESMFTTLERSVLPPEYDSYDVFTDAAFDVPPFHVFESATAIVDTVVDAVDGGSADDVGVVLDGASEYSALVESALEAANIPFYGGPGFADDPDHRAFLALLRTAHRGADTRVREVRPLLTALDVPLDVDHDEARLAAVEAPGLDWLAEFRAGVAEHTFGSALAAFEDRTGADLAAFRTELQRLGIADAAVTERGVDRLAFYLESYEVPVDRENEGVLLADARSAAYVDRPVVFHLGLDEGWTHSAPRRPWVDADAGYARNIREFQLLLQSGAQGYYLVQDAAGGSPVTPCLYLTELLDEEFERFSDLDHRRHTHLSDRGDDGFDRAGDPPTPDPAGPISQSSLNTYVNCPRDHYFDRLVASPQRDYFVEGNLFHDFAEFYVSHPAFVDDGVVEAVIEQMLAETDALTRPVDEPTRRSRYRAGLETIRAYFDANPPDGDAFLTPTGGWGTNTFADRFDRPVDGAHTERWFENDALGLKGKIDLVQSPTHLLDHKSGRKRSARRVVNGAAVDPPADTPNFQALLYLAHWRDHQPDERLSFTFFHFMEAVDDVVAGDEPDLAETTTTVTYRPTTFAAHARSEATFERLVEDGANDCRKTLSQVDHDDYAAVFDAADPPASADGDDLIESEFGRLLVERMQAVVGEYKYVVSGCEQALRELARVQGRSFFEEDLDAFEAFVADRLDELDRRRAGEERFPVEGLAGEPDYRRVNHRDLLLEGDR